MDTRPTHYLCIKKKETPRNKKWVQVGAAWENEKKHIHIKINAGTTLHWKELEDYNIYLFPNKED